jgi:pseudouridine-5'-phosphate glycosidase
MAPGLPHSSTDQELGRLVLAPEVADALAASRAVVALESTIISHGMPYPRNLETARACEAAVREAGAVPATVALMDGAIRVGLDASALDRLAGGPGHDEPVAKVSLRDLGAVLADSSVGATTVAATMFATARAGIRVFATGGIGGVHRDDPAGPVHDVSADLTALATIPVAVVCAGAKAVLDLNRTVEALETLGIPVVGQGTDVLPEFWTRGRDLPVSVRSDDPAATAALLDAHWGCGLTSGVVVANPIPTGDEADPEVISAAIESGLAAAGSAGVAGRDVTPFLLAHVAEATGGASLEANVALVINNAATAGAIAVELAARTPPGNRA